MNEMGQQSISIDEKTIIVGSIEKYTEIILLHNIGRQLNILDEKDVKTLEMLSQKKMLLQDIDDWKDFLDNCNSLAVSIQNRIFPKLKARVAELSHIMEITTSERWNDRYIITLLDSAKKSLEKDDLAGSYPFLEHAEQYTTKVIIPHDKFTEQLKLIQDEIQNAKPLQIEELRQIEKLMELAVETSKRNDYVSASEILDNCTKHIELNRDLLGCQKFLNEFEIELQQLKQMTLGDQKSDRVLEKLEERGASAWRSLGEKDYSLCLDNITPLQRELQVIEKKIRARYSSRLMNDIWAILDKNADGIIIETSEENKYKKHLNEMDNHMKCEKYRSAIEIGQRSFNELNELTFRKCKIFCHANGPEIDKLVNGLKLHNIESSEALELYQKYVRLESEMDFIECKSIIDKIRIRVNNSYNQHFNNILRELQKKESTEGLELSKNSTFVSGVNSIKKYLKDENYSGAFDMLNNIIKDVREGKFRQKRLKGKLSSLQKLLRELTLEKDEREEMEGKLGSIGRKLERKEFSRFEDELASLKTKIYDITESKLQMIDFLKYEMEEMGISTNNIFLELENAHRALEQGDLVAAYNIATEIKNSVQKVKQDIVSDSLKKPKADIEQKQLVEEEIISHTIWENTPDEQNNYRTTNALIETMEDQYDDSGVPVDRSLTPLESISNIELTEWMKELLQITKDISLQSGKVDQKTQNIQEIVHKTGELLEILSERGIDVSMLEADVQQAIGEAERGNVDLANNILQKCINVVMELMESKEMEIGKQKDLLKKFAEMKGVVRRFAGQGITLKGVDEMLVKGKELTEMNNIGMAENTLHEAELILEQRLQQYHDLEKSFEDIEERANNLKTKNIDIEDIDDLFKDIIYLAQKGEYVKARQMCEQGRAKLIRIEVLAPLKS